MSEETERLSQWMTANDYSMIRLAAAVGMSYDGIYQILHVRKRVSPGFKMKFIARFGWYEAHSLFLVPSTTKEPTPV